MRAHDALRHARQAADAALLRAQRHCLRRHAAMRASASACHCLRYVSVLPFSGA